MPDDSTLEYNPIICGFHYAHGPMNISLKNAKRQFGLFPSQFGYLSNVNINNKGRKESTVLNLSIGHFIKNLLEQKRNLKKEVYQFFSDWHRDFQTEFNVNFTPFFNINDAGELKNTIQANKSILQYLSTLDIKKEIEASGLIKKSTLNSIKPRQILLSKLSQILLKRVKTADNARRAKIRSMLNILNAHALVNQAGHLAATPLLSLDIDMIHCFADEITSFLMQLNQFTPLEGIQGLKGRTGQGLEFEYATRDHSYLELGKMTGDCTADKRYDQSDSDIENIFWTVFSWILDRNYQILKVYYNGQFVMKFHLLPLYVSVSGAASSLSTILPNRSDYMILAIDAIETTLAFRGKSKGGQQHHLFDQRDEIFAQTLTFINDLADRMNIKDIYAEKFSNTPWVRDKLDGYPEIFLNVDHIIKIDELEDVYCLAEELSDRYGYNVPGQVFMELQMKNTCLRPGYVNKSPGVKSFALIRGRSQDGIQMKKVIGV